MLLHFYFCKVNTEYHWYQLKWREKTIQLTENTADQWITLQVCVVSGQYKLPGLAAWTVDEPLRSKCASECCDCVSSYMTWNLLTRSFLCRAAEDSFQEVFITSWLNFHSDWNVHQYTGVWRTDSVKFTTTDDHEINFICVFVAVGDYLMCTWWTVELESILGLRLRSLLRELYSTDVQLLDRLDLLLSWMNPY